MIWAGDFRRVKFSHWLYFVGSVILAISLLVLLLTVARNSNNRFVKDWRIITNAYLDVEASIMGKRGSISYATKAKSPEIFKDKLAFMTFGEGVYFAVHRQPGEVSDGHAPDISTLGDGGISGRPIPYPPQLLWCVYLEHEGKKDAMFFLGYHKDIYSAEWIAHIGEHTPFSTEFRDFLTQLECPIPAIGD